MSIKQIYVVYNSVPIIYMYMNEKKGVPGSLVEEIEFNELGRYISLMKQQQEALGEFVNFQKGVWRENNFDYECILIDASDTPIPSTGESYTLKVWVNGIDPAIDSQPENFGGLQEVSQNVNIINSLIYASNCLAPIAAQILLEEITGTFENDYSVSTPTAGRQVYYVVTNQDGTYYTVYLFFFGDIANNDIERVDINNLQASYIGLGLIVDEGDPCGGLPVTAYFANPFAGFVAGTVVYLDTVGNPAIGSTRYRTPSGVVWSINPANGQLVAPTGQTCGGGLINYNINDVPGGVLEFLDENDNILDSYSTTTNPNASGSTTNSIIRKIRGRWESGSGNIVQLRVCGELSELYFNPNIIVGSDGVYTLPDNLGNYNETFFVSLRSGNITPPVCPI